MTIFSLPLAQIDAPKLDALVANAVGEGRQLDYKETLAGGSDDDKREFLSDVTSFGNALGGDIIFGLRERRERGRATGEPEAVVGLPGLNADAERLRLENLVRDGVAPRMPPLAFREVRRDPGPPCLVLRVPRSWAGLHMVTFKNLSRFYSRNSGGRYQLDVGEIRNALVGLETAQERIRRFRADRVARVLAGETPIAIGDGPKVIAHAIPVGATDSWARFQGLDLRDVVNFLPPLGGSAADWRHNLDGFVVHTHRRDPSINGYSQLFRDGGIEAVNGGLVRLDPTTGTEFYGTRIERSLVEAFRAYRQLWAMLEVTGPFMVGLVLSGVRGCRIVAGPQFAFDVRSEIDRDIVFIPDVVVEDMSREPSLLLRPLFDMLWNAGGWPASPFFRADGTWTGPPR
ncbi:MAG: helix-turn-helix domain-containing protein [Candidatus Methylomirabilales bacterium]